MQTAIKHMKSIMRMFGFLLLIQAFGTYAKSENLSFGKSGNEFEDLTKDTVIEHSSDLVCDQLNNALKFLKDNKIFTKKFKMDYKVRPGWGYDYFLTEYLSYKLNIPEENVWNTDSDKLKKTGIFLTENVTYEDTLMFIDNCNTYLKTKVKSNWSILISKVDSESMLIQFSYKKRPDLHGIGLVYLFFFDENNEVEKYFEYSWME